MPVSILMSFSLRTALEKEEKVDMVLQRYDFRHGRSLIEANDYIYFKWMRVITVFAVKPHFFPPKFWQVQGLATYTQACCTKHVFYS